MQKYCNRAAEDDAGEDPERPRQIAELRRQGRADERPRPRDRREVVTEHDPAVRRHEVAAVVDALGRRLPAVVEREEPCREKDAIETVGNRVHGDRCDDEPDGVHGLAAYEREPRHGVRAGAGERAPTECPGKPHRDQLCEPETRVQAARTSMPRARQSAFSSGYSALSSG